MPSHERKLSKLLFTGLVAWGSCESKPTAPWLWVTWCEEWQSALLACWRRAPPRQSFGPAGQLLSVSIQATRASTFKRGEVQSEPKIPLSNLKSTGYFGHLLLFRRGNGVGKPSCLLGASKNEVLKSFSHPFPFITPQYFLALPGLLSFRTTFPCQVGDLNPPRPCLLNSSWACQALLLFVGQVWVPTNTVWNLFTSLSGGSAWKPWKADICCLLIQSHLSQWNCTFHQADFILMYFWDMF